MKQKHNDLYLEEKAQTYTRFATEFGNDFCDPSGAIRWNELVKFNSGNLKEVEKVIARKRKSIKRQQNNR